MGYTQDFKTVIAIATKGSDKMLNKIGLHLGFVHSIVQLSIMSII